ncbi:MAG: ribulose-phosphate 3-epimerase [Proteobacteria bacterium]|nr:ribulose-phosphate 3-epimerase [Pseudomonadota bacterium]
MGRPLVAASILAVWDASAGDIEACVAAAVAAEASGADWIHVDIMDGRFVPKITFGSEMVKALKKRVKIPLDVHLMVEEPGVQMEEYIRAGSDRITFHPSASRNPKGRLELLREAGVVAGLALNVGETLGRFEPFKGLVDQVLVMTVEAGRGGQAFLPSMLEKVKGVRAMVGPDLPLVADGGVNAETAAGAVAAGANVLVAGTALFKGDYGEMGARIKALRGE